MSGHTPGPWEVEDLRPHLSNVTAMTGTDRERAVASEMTYVDAVAIAALPELLATIRAVRACETCGEDYGRCGACDRRLDAAISNAEGR